MGAGDSDGTDAFDPSVEWEAAPEDDLSDFGSYTCAIAGSSSPALAIPDNTSPGVSDTISITSSCTVASVEIDVDITHTYIGDLEVIVTNPDGTGVTVHDRSGGTLEDIVGTYPVDLTPDNVL